MLRRHFFLVGAIVVLLLMALAGAWKLTLGKSAPASGPPGAASKAGGPPGGGGGRGPGGGRPAQVNIITAGSHTFVDSIDVIGVAKGRQSVTLTAAATQLVDRVLFRDGQSVVRGAVLVELKDTEQNAGTAQAQARLVQAQRDFDRWKTLGEQGYASKAAIDQREATLASAQADLAAARSREADRTIRAPFAGVVGLSDIAPGALINPGAPIVTLDDVSAIRVDFDVPDRFLPMLREGQALTATTDAYPGETLSGRIQKLDSRIDERTRAITARAEFPNGDRRLRPGMMLRVSIARGQRQGIGIPENALAVQGQSAFVFAVVKQGKRMVAEQRPVVTGSRQGGFVEILDGVAIGDRLVGDGLNKIQPGQGLRPAGPPGGKPPAGARP